MNRRYERGIIGESLAIDYLRKNGCRIIKRNYRFEHGEVDIIAEDGDVLVFIEVKTFRSKVYGEPEDAVTIRKREKIRKTAEAYLFENAIEDKECRFDVIAIDLEKENSPVIRHIKDAF